MLNLIFIMVYFHFTLVCFNIVNFRELYKNTCEVQGINWYNTTDFYVVTAVMIMIPPVNVILACASLLFIWLPKLLEAE